jgi:hypothetical protein
MHTNNKIVVLTVCLIISLFAIACGGSTSSDSSSQTRCSNVSAEQLKRIQAGVQGVDPSNYIKSGSAVKSKDFNNVWMVAAYVYGTGMEDGAGPGVWAINGDPGSPGVTLAVDGYAKSFSDYPDASQTDASQTDASISNYDDGVQESIKCAESNH